MKGASLIFLAVSLALAGAQACSNDPAGDENGVRFNQKDWVAQPDVQGHVASLTCTPDCPGGPCIETSKGAQCGLACDVSECPLGMVCLFLAEGPFCVDRGARLCLPCRFDDECQVPHLGPDFRCAEGADGVGKYCTMTCSSSLPCPSGWDCQDHGHGNECFPMDGVCTCSPLAVALEGETDCASADGKCQGVFSCAGDAPGQCTAMATGAEVCNGLDDDCDGFVDEDFLDLNGNGIADCFEAIVRAEDVVSQPDVQWQEDVVVPPIDVISPPQDVVGPPGDSDNDGDPDNTDCAPTDPTVFHGNVESCNGFDDNCVDGIDEGFPNADGDGLKDCVDPDDDDDGTPDTADCAPTDPAIHSGASEVCNGIDDNCDGQKDPEGSSGCIPFRLDGDGDGYGTSASKCLCGKSGQYTAEQGGDCNDGDKTVHPGATEVCNGKDDDCDGTTDPPSLCQPTVTICLDPGDGGTAPGAVGIVTEKNVNLAMALKARDWLVSDTNNGSGGGTWKVIMTRDSDVTVSLEDRAAYANSNNAQRYVSIHNNACGSCGGTGTETYHKASADGTTQALAGGVQSKIVAALGLKNRGVKTAEWYVLTHTNMPAVTTFPGFVDTQGDVNLINGSTGQSNTGKAILHALQQSLGYGVFTP